ncbi:NAD(P)/FAD-dependent oxidoreductase [Pontibacter beigongshangensis]|uniref:NAD(P)/FAD-dependent oxidoreductase n=1 Tax=Pontibacter beigongshangensis TaxID=2574733 RepID=UPI001650A372|nr:FAD-dependent oxidoreductase [Pontibacter beigongshangensis]
MIYDFIIVGHGLAGAILAYTLRKKGYQVLVIDELAEHSASKVAAGLVNPVAGKRFAKSWMADTFIPAADAFYKELEEHFGQELYLHKPIYKIFSSIEEQNNWMAKSAGSDWSDYISETLVASAGEPGIQDPYGGILIRRGGHLLVREVLQLLEQEQLQAGQLLPERFDFSHLELTETGLRYKGEQARQLIFCEGYQVIHNPYFRWLPLQPTKGEVLEVKTDYKFISECIYNKAVYVLPKGDGAFRIGATYNWRQPDELPTHEGQQELTGRFTQITSHAFNVTNHWAGIRPAVRDRRPLVGSHPQHPQLLVFNGMGSKGVLMAPYLAERFAAALAGEADVLPEVNISRYFSLYYDYIKQ